MKVETQDKFGGKATQNLSQTKKLYNIYLDFILKWGGRIFILEREGQSLSAT